MGGYMHQSRWFYGVEIPLWDMQAGYISYATLAKAFDAVLCNGILEYAAGAEDYPELVNGREAYHYRTSDDAPITEEEASEVDSYGVYPEVYQWYVINGYGADILQACTDDLVYYLDGLGVYVWGVRHWGTSWTIVSTDIKIDPAICASVLGGDNP